MPQKPAGCEGPGERRHSRHGSPLANTASTRFAEWFPSSRRVTVRTLRRRYSEVILQGRKQVSSEAVLVDISAQRITSRAVQVLVSPVTSGHLETCRTSNSCR
jgi:hypothetical protein